MREEEIYCILPVVPFLFVFYLWFVPGIIRHLLEACHLLTTRLGIVFKGCDES